MQDTIDIHFMKRALELSRKGMGFVNPNPLVGAVLVQNGKIIGEGFHEKYGGPHAEVNAVNDASGNVSESTLYVTLEPCNHQGKTPACTNLILKEKISRVVVGMEDPNPLVSGKSIAQLRARGIEVSSGNLNKEIKKLNESYVHYIATKKPFVVMKAASSLDGKIATRSRQSKWISSKASRQHAHELRHRYSGIMIGINTLLTDDPLLNDRSENQTKKHPYKIVVDSKGKTPLTAKILTDNPELTIIATTSKIEPHKKIQLEETGAKCLVCPELYNQVDLNFLMKELGANEIDSILLEGGGNLNFSALKAGIVNKVVTYISPKLIGGKDALTAIEGEGFDEIDEAIQLKIESFQTLGGDLVIESYPKK